MIWVILGLVALMLLWANRSIFLPKKEDKIPPALQKSLDSLTATKAEFDRLRDSISKTVRVDTVRAIGHNTVSELTQQDANELRRQSQILAERARVSGDSATLWRQAYEKSSQAYNTLQKAYFQKDSAFQAEQRARRSLTNLYVADTLRRVAVEDANKRLKERIAELDVPCKVVGILKCPSRTSVAVVATVATVAATVVVVNSVQNRKNEQQAGTKAGFSIRIR